MQDPDGRELRGVARRDGQDRAGAGADDTGRGVVLGAGERRGGGGRRRADPGSRATAAATERAASTEPTGPCQGTGTDRAAAAVVVRSECATNTSIAPSSATAIASSATRITVRAGARTRSCRANLTASLMIASCR